MLRNTEILHGVFRRVNGEILFQSSQRTTCGRQRLAYIVTGAVAAESLRVQRQQNHSATGRR